MLARMLAPQSCICGVCLPLPAEHGQDKCLQAGTWMNSPRSGIQVCSLWGMCNMSWWFSSHGNVSFVPGPGSVCEGFLCSVLRTSARFLLYKWVYVFLKCWTCQNNVTNCPLSTLQFGHGLSPGGRDVLARELISLACLTACSPPALVCLSHSGTGALATLALPIVLLTYIIFIHHWLLIDLLLD